VLAIVASACDSSSKTTSSTTAGSAAPTSTAATPKGSGPVDVLYAGSLVDVMTKQISPAFDTATGYTFTGDPGDSGALATMIKGKVQQADVFISASAAKNTGLEGTANGNSVSWYATFASSPLVLGYNPKSKFAADLRSKPWYQVLSEPGILIGRTDPTTDPKGVLAVQALSSAATTDDAPGLGSAATSTSNVFPETDLVGRLQSGQLDVGFFYEAEAKAASIPTVPLIGQDLQATYTVTVLNNAPHPAAASAFVSYLLGARAKGPLAADGFDLITPPEVTGTGVPASLQGVLAGQ
jgi:molybdate/tungstate transport system substrate-binding protein